MKVTQSRVIKPVNGGVALYVTVRFTELDDLMVRHDRIDSPTELAKREARLRGWDPDGRGHAGYRSQYGVDSYEQTFIFEHCLCHGIYGCKEATKDVVWKDLWGEEPEDRIMTKEV